MSKEHAIASRRLKWETINWANSDAAIARHMGVDRKAAAHQRRTRGKKPLPHGGPRYPGKPEEYPP